MQPTPRPALGVLMVLTGSVLFAVNGTVSKLVLETGVDAPQLTTIRATGAALGLFVLVLVTGPRRLRVRPRELGTLAVYGLCGFFLVPMLYFVAIGRLPVGISLLFEYTSPLLVALWMRFVQGHPVKPRMWVGQVASLVGLACVAEVWGELRLDGLGIAAALTAACLLTVYYLLSARGVTRRDPTSLTLYAFLFASVAGALVRPLWSFGLHRLGGSTHGVPVWLLTAYIIIGGSILPYLLLAGAMRHLPATSVGILGMIEPVTATAVAWLVLGERLDLAQLAGGALILIGVTLAETARIKPSKALYVTGESAPNPEAEGATTPAPSAKPDPVK